METHCLSSNLCDQEILYKQTLHALILSSKQTVDVKIALELSGSINKIKLLFPKCFTSVDSYFSFISSQLQLSDDQPFLCRQFLLKSKYHISKPVLAIQQFSINHLLLIPCKRRKEKKQMKFLIKFVFLLTVNHTILMILVERIQYWVNKLSQN